VKPPKEPPQEAPKNPEKPPSNQQNESFLKSWFKKTFRKFGNDHKKDKDAKPKTKEESKASTIYGPKSCEVELHYSLHILQELPRDALKVVKSSDIPFDLIHKHFDVALNALHFQTKLKFKSIDDKRKNTKIPKIAPSPKTKERPKPDIALISKEDPKKLYKIQREEGKG
jgi:hypothetical protein